VRFAIPEGLLNQLRAWRSDRAGQLSSVEREQDAFCIGGESIQVRFLTSDGRVLVCEDNDALSYTDPREASHEEAIAAVVIASDRAHRGGWMAGISGLHDLLPKRPSDAAGCVTCDGSRFSKLDQICRACGGLGWSLPPATTT
jgi:hypothetical protein